MAENRTMPACRPISEVSTSIPTIALAPSSFALYTARLIASHRAFSISVVKAVTSPPISDSKLATNLPNTPRVRGVNPVTSPRTLVILYPAIVGVVTMRNDVVAEAAVFVVEFDDVVDSVLRVVMGAAAVRAAPQCIQ